MPRRVSTARVAAALLAVALCTVRGTAQVPSAAERAESLELQAATAFRDGSPAGRVAELWYLAAAAWAEEAARAVLTQDYERFERARLPHLRTWMIAISEDGCPQVMFSRNNVEFIAGAWYAVRQGDGLLPNPAEWGDRLLDVAEALRAMATRARSAECGLEGQSAAENRLEPEE